MCFQFSVLNIDHSYGCHLNGRAIYHSPGCRLNGQVIM
jgi:hypothetical protein